MALLVFLPGLRRSLCQRRGRHAFRTTAEILGVDKVSKVAAQFLAAALASLSIGAQAEPSNTESTERDRYLLLDSRIIDYAQNAKITLGEVEKHHGNPLVEEDKPWERRFDNLYANVLYDAEEGVYKCWYSPFINSTSVKGMTLEERKKAKIEAPPDHEMAVCYATSKDGIRWVKPELGLVTYEGKKANNIVIRATEKPEPIDWFGPHGTGVFKDLRERDPNRRYKAILSDFQARSIAVAFSPDGIHWGPKIICPGAVTEGDTHNNAFWAPTLGEYVAISREWGLVGKDKERRQVVRTSSCDFVHWSQDAVVLEGSDLIQQTYAMPTFYHGGIYLGLLAILNVETQRVWTELAWSADTRTWQRVLPGTALIPTSQKEGDYDWGCVFAAANPVFRKDEIRLYYLGSDYTHAGLRNGYLCLATLRPDGFAGYTPTDSTRPATITTTVIGNRKGQLRLSADVGQSGYLTVRVLDEHNKVLGEGEQLEGKCSDKEIVWRKGFSFDQLGEKPARLQFEFRDAKVFSFSFK